MSEPIETLKIEDPTSEMFSGLRKINEHQEYFIDRLRNQGIDLIDLINWLPNSRRKSIAITHIETAVMFATKAATYGE
jgi:hypothetical protein